MDEINQQRNMIIYKANELIRQSHFELSLQEQRLILYCISKIKPEDIDFKTYSIRINEFCQICGINPSAGGRQKSEIKDLLGQLASRMWWVDSNGKETLTGWIEKPTINNGSGTVEIRLDKGLKPYLLQLKNKFTAYPLLNVLAMKSKYSVRLYELLKSYLYMGEIVLSVEELKKSTGSEGYSNITNIKKRVIKPAMEDIDKYSDLSVTWEEIKEGKKISAFRFKIEERSPMDKYQKWETIRWELDSRVMRGESDGE